MEIRGTQAGRQKASGLYCRSCQNYTNHTMQYALAYREHTVERAENEGGPYRLCDNWAIWKCDGCGTPTLAESQADLEEFQRGELDADYMDYATFYPMESVIQTKRIIGIPDKLNKIYTETIAAFNNGLEVLCAIGLRSIIEALCDDKEISSKHDSLERKIDALTKLGISAKTTEGLHGFRFMGNTAAHELMAPSETDLRIAIEIIEEMLNLAYALEIKAAYLRNTQRRRPKFIISEDTGDSD